MRKKLINMIVICLTFLFAFSLIGCSQQENNESSINKKPFQEIIASNSSQIETLSGTNEDVNWEELEASYNPPKIESLLQTIKDSKTTANGSVVITSNIKREFNQMGEDYQFFFMPKVTGYDFEGRGEALAYILFTWTGEFGIFPEKAPKYEAEARLRKIFTAPNNEYPPLEHKEYRKTVMFDGEAYSLWPESYNNSTKIYDLTDLKVRQDGKYTYYTALFYEYQFDLTGSFEPTENEIFLNTQAKALGFDQATTLSKLLETGKITSAPKSTFYTIEFSIDGDKVIPKIVSFNKGI